MNKIIKPNFPLQKKATLIKLFIYTHAKIQ